MTPDQVFDIGKQGISTLLVMATPIMLIALGVGLIIALFQALTSIQEITLTFVPKILAVFLALVLLLPFISEQLFVFAQELFAQIASSGS